MDEDEEDEEKNIDDADMFSETTSVGGSVATTTKSKSTLATRQTNRSARSAIQHSETRLLFPQFTDCFKCRLHVIYFLLFIAT